MSTPVNTHTAIAITSKGQFDVIQVPTEEPGEGEVLLKVEYSSINVLDTYTTDLAFLVQDFPLVLGFNASGTIKKVGNGVKNLSVGDRVTAFSYAASRSKGMQEYSIQPYTTCAKIPYSMSFEEAATIPDNFVTAFFTLFNQLSLPLPASFSTDDLPPLAHLPILIYGAGSTAGQYAIQLLRAAKYQNIIATASTKHHAYLRYLGATSTFDYNSPRLAQIIAAAVGGDGKVRLAMDCITTEGTLEKISQIIAEDATVALLLPIKDGNALTVEDEGNLLYEMRDEKNPFGKGVKIVPVVTLFYQKDNYLKENLLPKILPQLLADGTVTPNRVKLLDQGSFKSRVGNGLALPRNNKVSGEKVVIKVGA